MPKVALLTALYDSPIPSMTTISPSEKGAVPIADQACAR